MYQVPLFVYWTQHTSGPANGHFHTSPYWVNWWFLAECFYSWPSKKVLTTQVWIFVVPVCSFVFHYVSWTFVLWSHWVLVGLRYLHLLRCRKYDLNIRNIFFFVKHKIFHFIALMNKQVSLFIYVVNSLAIILLKWTFELVYYQRKTRETH